MILSLHDLALMVHNCYISQKMANFISNLYALKLNLINHLNNIGFVQIFSRMPATTPIGVYNLS